MDLIAEQTLGSAGIFDFQSIPSGYSDLLLVATVRGTLAAATTDTALRFNADSGTNYDTQRLHGEGTSASSAENFGSADISVNQIPAASATADVFGQIWLWLASYADAALNKTMVGNGASKWGVASGNMRSRRVGGFWRSNAAVTRVQFLESAGGNFAAASSARLYGAAPPISSRSFVRSDAVHRAGRW